MMAQDEQKHWIIRFFLLSYRICGERLSCVSCFMKWSNGQPNSIGVPIGVPVTEIQGPVRSLFLLCLDRALKCRPILLCLDLALSPLCLDCALTRLLLICIPKSLRRLDRRPLRLLCLDPLPAIVKSLLKIMLFLDLLPTIVKGLLRLLLSLGIFWRTMIRIRIREQISGFDCLWVLIPQG